ncbi:MAG: tagaturonate epimerase family protein [Acidobacteriia bacterium]|nr:tagaturonate epimerase family protein [Terriglobia bacterium]
MAGPEALPGWAVRPHSMVEVAGTTFCLAANEDGQSKVLVVRGESRGFEGTGPGPRGELLCPLNRANAAALRARLPWLRPVPLGLRTSVGFGDRLGLATPGHARAIRQFPGGEGKIAGVFAQQSVRENARTGRTPQEVLDDATWGLFQEGWREPWGADADHLKTPTDVDDFAAAGYTFFTIDPGTHVDDKAHDLPPAALEARVRALPWDALEDSLGDLKRRYLSEPFDLEGSALNIDTEQLWRGAVKYGRAVAHTVAMYRHIVSRLGDRAFELEVSVDETSNSTTVAEHVYIARELRRLGVRWVSLAPRFVGRFEKGVDYIGDLGVFSAEFARHAAVSRVLGPYKLSLHSGSDKFSVYPVAARLTDGSSMGLGGPLVHVKTAGTSYLEALRATARVDGELFREILTYARERYEHDRMTYHVSATLARVPSVDSVKSADLPLLLEKFDARQVMHVTFGSVLDRFGDRLRETLRKNEEIYATVLEAHFRRHLAPLLS